MKLRSIYNAIEKEKELKDWNRKKKEELIKTLNPQWKDLYPAYFHKKRDSYGMTKT
jgi:predicted GIY-YIG superfamily endonuclease